MFWFHFLGLEEEFENLFEPNLVMNISNIEKEIIFIQNFYQFKLILVYIYRNNWSFDTLFFRTAFENWRI
jgi:hypothetical protein